MFFLNTAIRSRFTHRLYKVVKTHLTKTQEDQQAAIGVLKEALIRQDPDTPIDKDDLTVLPLLLGVTGIRKEDKMDLITVIVMIFSKMTTEQFNEFISPTVSDPEVCNDKRILDELTVFSIVALLWNSLHLFIGSVNRSSLST
jgi:hypothetical protein